MPRDGLFTPSTALRVFCNWSRVFARSKGWVTTNERGCYDTLPDSVKDDVKAQTSHRLKRMERPFSELSSCIERLEKKKEEHAECS